MMLNVLLAVLVWAIALAPIPALLSCGYLWLVYSEDLRKPRSWLIRTLSITATAVTIAAVYFGYLAVERLQGHPLPLWVVPLSGVVVLLLDAVPVYKAVMFYRASHGSGKPNIQA